jgi:nitrogen fixation NifU-like protein
MSVEDEQRLYEDHVLRHFEEPYHRGHLATATHLHRVDNPVCGDSVQVELVVSNTGIIEQAWFTGVGCIISQAAASMLIQHIEGQSLNLIRTFSANDMLALFRARLTARRQHCCLLGWKALIGAIQPPS